MCACSLALDHARPLHFCDRPESGRRQQASSGQVDDSRLVVSRPRNHFECTNGTPTVIENSPAPVDAVCVDPVCVDPVCVESKNVPSGVSVYW